VRLRASVAAAALAGVSLVAYGEPPALPEGTGRAEFERACTQCHSLETVLKTRRTRAQWEAKLDAMIAKGAKLSDADFDLIAAYLAQHFGAAQGQVAR
jgi:mono/diheme cytochrome c family protein